jgi:uncharacterized membrane protein
MRKIKHTLLFLAIASIIAAAIWPKTILLMILIILALSIATFLDYEEQQEE